MNSGPGSYANMLAFFKERFHADVNRDIVFREFATQIGVRCFLFFLDGMANVQQINDFILRPLMRCDDPLPDIGQLVTTASLQVNDQADEIVSAVLSGDTAIFIEGALALTLCETKGFEKRSVSTPQTEVVIKGSQEAFNESVRTNITLIRRSIKNADLVSEFIPVGALNQDTCAVLYIEGLTNPELVAEVKRRIEGIRADYIEGTGMLEQFISGSGITLLPSLLSTERPERAANYLCEGRVVIICDGTPFALIAPVSLSLMLESSELNTMRWQSGSFIKLIRLASLFFATLLPGIYVALVCFHREMIPTQLLSSIILARENIPFPTPLSVVLLTLFFELIREAGQRIPRSLGGAIGIVGGLILGQAAVSANLVSPVTLIVVAVAGLSNVAVPDYDLSFSLRIIQLFLILAACISGFLGVVAVAVILLAIMVNEQSFGRPMLSFRSMRWVTGSSLFFQRPLWKQERRAGDLGTLRPASQPKKSKTWQ